MRRYGNRWIAWLMLAVMSISTLGGFILPAAAASKAKKWRNIAIGAAAVTGYGLLKHKKTVAIVGGVGTAYAYSRYRKHKKVERRSREARRIQWYKDRYGRNWREHYRRGA